MHKNFCIISSLFLCVSITKAQPAKDKTMSTRKPKYKVANSIINRWSPRAMSGESISNEELLSLFEAARWAPSSYNSQPWRFVYAKRDSKDWQTLFDLLVPFNQEWCKNAAVLIVIISKNDLEYPKDSGEFQPSRTHSFDTGAAWENLALQGSMNGLVVHGMEGFDYDKAKEVLHVPDGYTVEAMCAVGKPGNKEDLPEEMQEYENMSDRNPVKDFVLEGSFK